MAILVSKLFARITGNNGDEIMKFVQIVRRCRISAILKDVRYLEFNIKVGYALFHANRSNCGKVVYLKKLVPNWFALCGNECG